MRADIKGTSISESSKIRALCEQFWEIERQFDLFNKKIDNIDFWILLRVSLFSAICEQKGVYGSAQDNLSSKSIVDKLLIVSGAIKNFFLNKPFNTSSKKFFFVGHPRRKYIDGLWWDLYVDPILDKMEMDYYFLEHPYLGRHFTPAKSSDIKFIDLQDTFIRWKSSRSRVKLTREDESFIQQIEDAVNSRFGVCCDIEKMVHKRVPLHKMYEKFYFRLLSKVRPSIMFLVVNYLPSSFALTSVCKRLGIPVVELQHGTIFKNHMGYSFPDLNIKCKYHPDYIFTFGDFWKNGIQFPIPSDKVLTMGYPFFSERVSKLRADAQNKNVITFISQGTIGKELAKIALRLRNKLSSDYTINYKLHSSEYSSWRKSYEGLDSSPGINVIENDKQDLYETMVGSELIVGVYSTALYEAIALGVPVVLIDLPGIDSMETLIDLCPEIVINGEDDIVQLSKEGFKNASKIDKEFIFETAWMENLSVNVDRILKRNSSS
ncbi:hypothetical protein RCC89_08930 [Cytophagaceae bacterium ABcell3]|nr:hypothetical protein RCC89_08930 [Cytophagaceae bacterium ABcell3]